MKKTFFIFLPLFFISNTRAHWEKLSNSIKECIQLNTATPSMLEIGINYNANSLFEKGDLEIKATLHNPALQINQSKVSLDIHYENIPGLLGRYGHVQGKLNLDHHSDANTVVKIASDAVVQNINTIIDYNPKQQKAVEKKIVITKKITKEDRYQKFLIEKKIFEETKYDLPKETREKIEHIISQIETQVAT
jgi:hypothetical protein